MNGANNAEAGRRRNVTVRGCSPAAVRARDAMFELRTASHPRPQRSLRSMDARYGRATHWPRRTASVHQYTNPSFARTTRHVGATTFVAAHALLAWRTGLWRLRHAHQCPRPRLRSRCSLSSASSAVDCACAVVVVVVFRRRSLIEPGPPSSANFACEKQRRRRDIPLPYGVWER
ncbi:hypothetical protein FKP32DRAFT_97218 [Trametes sanguinea]|nr:hypothetical protein FKP32DRAFT_97218 [Trametes sanguinea]